MKNLILLLLSLIVVSFADSASGEKMETSHPFVAIDRLAKQMPNEANSFGTEVVGAEVAGATTIYTGYGIRTIDSEKLPFVKSLLFSKLKESLEEWGWVISCDEDFEPNYELNPQKFFATARRAQENIEIQITIFPSLDGSIRIAHSQRNIGKSSNNKGTFEP